jgi:hypothetical protein
VIDRETLCLNPIGIGGFRWAIRHFLARVYLLGARAAEPHAGRGSGRTRRFIVSGGS